MSRKGSSGGSGRSIEILPPDGLGLWKGSTEDPKATEERKRRQRNRRVAGVILAMIVAIAIPIGWKITHQSAAVPDPGAIAPEHQPLSSDTLSAALLLRNSQAPKDSEVRIASAGTVPASVYASSLEAVRVNLEEGKEDEAETKLKALPQEALGDRRIQQFAGVLWNNLGVQQRAKGSGSGMAAFKAALSIDSTQPEAYRNLGRLYIELKDPGLTRDFLEKALVIVPDDPWLRLALAEIHYKKDDFDAASTQLDYAAALVSRYPDVQSAVRSLSSKLKAASKAEQPLLNRQSSHFQVKFEGGDDYEIWNRVLEILEEAYQEVGRELGHYPSKPITVVLLTRESFHNSTGGPAWSDGLFDPILGRIKIPTAGALTDQVWLTRVLRHEFVHALLHDKVGGRLGAIPTWLNEGLAMQFAGDPLPDIPELIRGEVQLIPLNHLEGPWGALPPKMAMVAYLEGNSATVYLVERFRMEKVRELIGALANGQSIAAAMQDRLFFPYEEFQRRWIDHLNEKIRAGKTT